MRTVECRQDTANKTRDMKKSGKKEKEMLSVCTRKREILKILSGSRAICLGRKYLLQDSWSRLATHSHDARANDRRKHKAKQNKSELGIYCII